MHCYRLVIVCLFLAVLVAFAVPARAATPDTGKEIELANLAIEELMEITIPTVYGASKFDQKITDAPASVSVVTAEEIQKYGYRTLADILRAVRGLYVTYDHNYHYLGIRGLNRPGDYNSRVLLLLDGHRINDAVYGQAAIGTDFPLDADLIDRVEIIRGPSSSLYGSSAFFGAINVITRNGRALKHAEVALAAGSHDTYSSRLSYGNSNQESREMLVSASFFTSQGEPRLYYAEFDSPATNNGIANRGDDDRSYSVFSKFAIDDLTVSGLYASREKLIPTGSYGTIFNDDRNRTTDSRGYVDLKYNHAFANHGTLTARAYFDEYVYRGQYVYDATIPGDPPILNQDRAWGQWAGAEVLYVMRAGMAHLITLGGETRYNWRQDQQTYDEAPYFSQIDDRRTSHTYALYVQDEYHLLPNLILNAGVRFDHYDTFGSTINPRLALIYEPWARGVFKLLYGDAFRAPNVYELYYHDSNTTMKPNPDLKPEKIKTYELAYEQYYGDHLRTSFSGFYYELRDLISQQSDQDNLLIFRNVEALQARGMEAELEGRWPGGWQARASYVLQEATSKDTGDVLTNSPRHLVKLNLVAPLVEGKIFASGEVQYMSSRKTLALNTEAGYTTINVTLFSQNILKGLELSASVYNALDRSYRDPGSGEHAQDAIEQDGRTIRFKCLYRF